MIGRARIQIKNPGSAGKGALHFFCKPHQPDLTTSHMVDEVTDGVCGKHPLLMYFIEFLIYL